MAANYDDESESAEKSRPGPDVEYQDEEFIKALRSLEYPYVTGTVDVAEAVGCNEQTAWTRLNELWEDGRICKKSIGRGQRLVWFLPEEDLE